ncbi:hypothetical protein TNCV_68801 [Trichonephila clavipes]|nr:hypothetical protein TNCV_68801 [Trichonephila clavipes]
MLPVLGKKAVLEWCKKEGLIGSSYVCPKCGKNMELRERTEAQQSMRAGKYCAPHNTRDHWFAEVHEQMSRFGGLSEERPSVFKTRSKLGTHLSTQCSGDERQSRPCAAR